MGQTHMEEEKEKQKTMKEKEERERMIKEEDEMMGKPWYTLVPSVPRSKWKRFYRPTAEEVKEVRDGFEALGLKLGKRHRPPTGGDDDDDDLDPFGVHEGLRSLPNFLLEYTADDDRRFAEEMAHADKLMAEAEADADATLAGWRAPVSPPPPEVVLAPEDHRAAAPGRVPEAEVKRLRHVATARFVPVSERFLSQPFFTEAAALEIRECDRFISKVYSMSREAAAAALEEHDAKGYLDADADGGIVIPEETLAGLRLFRND
ncbi:hypothetical protein ACP4OV_020800 [Aristida adscensionis]